MGVTFSRGKIDFEVLIKTGDVKGSGTDSNVYCCLVDTHGNKSRDLFLDCRFRNDFEKGNEDIFKIQNASNLSTIVNVVIWRDGKGLGDDWFVDYIKVRKVNNNNNNNKKNIDDTMTTDNNNNNSVWLPFPCNRWILPNRKYYFSLYDSILPQDDKMKEQRDLELAEKQETYLYETEITGLPRRVS